VKNLHDKTGCPESVFNEEELAILTEQKKKKKTVPSVQASPIKKGTFITTSAKNMTSNHKAS
jgi:hypothetical protein